MIRACRAATVSIASGSWVAASLLCGTTMAACVRPVPLAVQQPDALQAIAAAAVPLTLTEIDYEPLLDLMGDARFVLLGESTHGTRVRRSGPS